MTKRMKILLPILVLLAIPNLYYLYLEKKAYDYYTESDHCLEFPLLVMELGLEDALRLEVVRSDNEDAFFYFRAAEWSGTESAARDCVDIGD